MKSRLFLSLFCGLFILSCTLNRQKIIRKENKGDTLLTYFKVYPLRKHRAYKRDTSEYDLFVQLSLTKEDTFGIDIFVFYENNHLVKDTNLFIKYVNQNLIKYNRFGKGVIRFKIDKKKQLKNNFEIGLKYFRPINIRKIKVGNGKTFFYVYMSRYGTLRVND